MYTLLYLTTLLLLYFTISENEITILLVAKFTQVRLKQP